jgi:hypothetical protein
VTRGWHDVPAVRGLTATTRGCAWPEHRFEEFRVTPHDAAMFEAHDFVLVVLCATCGRTVAEAMAAVRP